MRKKDERLRAALLTHAREIVDSEGVDAVNIRRIAAQAGIASGTVYHYFASKDEILLSLTEEYWQETLAHMDSAVTAQVFPQALAQIYGFLAQSMDGPAAALMGSLGRVEADGRARMCTMQQLLRSALLCRMDEAHGLRPALWSEAFSKEDYADFVVSNLLLHLAQRRPDIDFFAEIVRRTICGFPD